MQPNSRFAHHLGYHMPSSRWCVLGTYLSVSGHLDFLKITMIFKSSYKKNCGRLCPECAKLYKIASRN